MPEHPERLFQSATPATELVRSFKRGTASPVDAVKASVDRMRACESILGAMVSTFEDQALRDAQTAERLWRAGEAPALAGVPVTIKDTFAVAGSITTYGSRVYRGNRTLEDSGAIRRLRAAGAVILGKTNTAEFGQSATCENLLDTVTRNPWNTDSTPGGSSGGAAVSVAAGYAPLALGADGGGSIRIPAAMTGLVGFKPSFGLCADEGGFRGMSDFCCAGPLTKTVADACLMLSVLADKKFVRSAARRSLRIGFCAAPDSEPVEKEIRVAVRRAADLLCDLGQSVEETALQLGGWEDAFGPLVLAEERRERGHLLDRYRADLTDYELASLLKAAELTPEIVHDARARHDRYRDRIAALFRQFDVLLLPTTATSAFAIGQRPREIDGQRVGRLWGAFPFTAAFNVAGNPAAALPCGLVEGLPISVQLVADCGQDATLLDLAEDLEEALDFRSSIANGIPRRQGDHA